MKIVTAEKSVGTRELSNLQGLAKHSKQHLSAKRIVQLLDHFHHEGPNGSHLCLVFELLGPTVDMIITDLYQEAQESEESIYDTEDILNMSTQILEAVSFMHKAGYGHGGMNILNLIDPSPFRFPYNRIHV